MDYKIINGDLLNLEDVECIVNPANQFLTQGGGLCGKIYRAAGIELNEETKYIGVHSFGFCAITGAYRLPYKYIIHAVTPIYSKVENKEEILANTYFNAITLAKEYGIKCIAFPLLASNHNGYPEKIAYKVALDTLSAMKETDFYNGKVFLVCNRK